MQASEVVIRVLSTQPDLQYAIGPAYSARTCREHDPGMKLPHGQRLTAYQQSPDSCGRLGIHTRHWLLAGSCVSLLPPRR